MANAKQDNNRIPTMTGVLNSDGTTPTNITAIAATHVISVSDGSDGTDYGNDAADRDDNMKKTLTAVSSDDGETPVPLYVDSSGNLLIKTT